MLQAKYTVETDLGVKIPVEIMRFPTGEVNARVHIDSNAELQVKDHILVTVQGYDANTLFVLACIKDGINDLMTRSAVKVNVHLFMPYLPNARYDRHMNDGDGFALKVFGSMLNLLKFDRVMVADPHSDTASAVINNFVQVPQDYLVLETLTKYKSKSDFNVLVAPDAGAAKKIYKTAKALNLPVVTMSKSRDTLTGHINGVYLLDELPDNAKCLIIDDICDGGRTFTEAAKVLRADGAESVSLYVTHGIFSKGVEVLFDNGIDSIYTTDSYNNWSNSDKMFVYKLFA